MLGAWRVAAEGISSVVSVRVVFISLWQHSIGLCCMGSIVLTWVRDAHDVVLDVTRAWGAIR